MRSIFSIAVVLLSACSAGPVPRPNVAAYDLGGPAAGDGVPLVGRVEVVAPSWLATTAMQYRFADSAASRRQTFAESRWVAAPAEMLEVGLKGSLLRGDVKGAQSCRLRVEIDEFIQSFDASGEGSARWALRAALFSRYGDAPLARRSLVLNAPAGRDARQGVVAFAGLQQRLASDLGQWIEQLATDARISEACRA